MRPSEKHLNPPLRAKQLLLPPPRLLAHGKRLRGQVHQRPCGNGEAAKVPAPAEACTRHHVTCCLHMAPPAGMDPSG